MMYKIIAALGTLALTAGLADVVQARPAPSNLETENNTLSQSSEISFENRSVADDYRQFFGVRNSGSTSVRTARENVKESEFFSPTADVVVLQIDEDTELLISEPLPPITSAIPFKDSGIAPFDDRDGVKVQTRLTE